MSPTLHKLLHAALYLAGLFGGAQLIQWSGVAFRAYEPGAFYTPDGTKVPVAEIVNFLTGGGYMAGGGTEHPRGGLTPGLRVKQGYDRPRWDYFDAQGCILVEHNSLGFRDEERMVTKREEEVLQLIADGCSTPEVAERLYISQKTVKNHLASIYQKLDARDRTQAVLQAVRMGIVHLH